MIRRLKGIAPKVVLVFSAIISVGAQSNGTGLLAGEITDASGAVVRSAAVTITNEATSQRWESNSNALGLYRAPLLPPGLYTVEVRSTGFVPLQYRHIAVDIASSKIVSVRLTVGSQQTVAVSAPPEVLDTAANFGSVTDRAMIADLPLATRNYTQVLGLNAGVASEVADAGALGRGSTSYSGGPGGFSSNGAGTNDNNFQLDGTDVNDIQGSGSFSRGVPVPNPDALEEFRVSTQPYDASQGRNSGASISVATRPGTSEFHGSLFEYFRNEALNANSYFRNTTGQPRAALKQNQFGATLGGPIIRPLLLAFGSYQETRQSNGLDPLCSSSVSLPPLTNDRSAAAIGALFQGQQGYFQQAFGGVGPSIAANGSNINPVALAVLQSKNSDGTYLIPTPQVIDSTGGNFDSRGLSTFSHACPYSEHQGLVSIDWQLNQRQHLSAHGFLSNSNTQETFPGPLLGGSTLPSSPYHIADHFRTLSIAHTWVARPALMNEFRFGFNRMKGSTTQYYPFTFSGIGATVPSFDDASPLLTIAGTFFGWQCRKRHGCLKYVCHSGHGFQ